MKNKTPRVYHHWSMYDWANSAYNLVITSTIFPAYYTAITSIHNSDGDLVSDKVSFFGLQLSNSALFTYSLAFAYLLICILSPILSSIADAGSRKKFFLNFFCALGAMACAGLYFFTAERLELGIILFMIATIGFCGSLVFYNAFLPEIAPDQDRDRLSARGFAYGYVGSVLLQLVCFVFVLNPGWFGQDVSWASRFSFLLVGIWWISFGLNAIRKLPERRRPALAVHRWKDGFKTIRVVLKALHGQHLLKNFLIAFFLYSMGVQTVMLAATLFGTKVLNLGETQLITTILLIQLVAIGGAMLMSRLSARFGNIRVISWVVLVWVAVCVAAYFVETAMHFYIIASVVGLVMGGIQSLSRSTYAKIMPATADTASYFSFYDISEKLAIVLGMFSFGLIDQLSGNMRFSIIALMIFFVAGWLVLLRCRNIARKQLG